jgi:MraZ protein
VFVGRHERQLDPKGRLAMPSAFRPRFEPSCFLAFGNDGCIDVFTREEFEQMAQEATEKMKRGELSRDAWRVLAHNSFEATVDTQGRINIERDLREFAGLEVGSKVVVAGSYDRVEIWNTDGYARVRARGTSELKGAS